MLEKIQAFFLLLRYGEKIWGYKNWDGKPKLYIGMMYYDGWHFVIHLGKFWFEMD